MVQGLPRNSTRGRRLARDDCRVTDTPSPRFALLAVAALAFPQAVKRLADHQEYLVRAQTIGASKEDAERVLAEVRTELAHRGGDPTRATAIAYRRLLDVQMGPR